MSSSNRIFGIILWLVLLLSTFVAVDAGWAAGGKIAAGGAHSALIKADGTLWAWGANSRGQLGDGSTLQRTAPVAVGTGTDWTALAAGGATADTSFTLAIKGDGTLWGFGDNSVAQLGIGLADATVHPNPVKVNNDTDWVAAAAGSIHAVALKSDGSLRAWGRNRNGQLGDLSTTDQVAPVSVSIPGGRRIIAVAAGDKHTLALAADGTVWSWGGNRYGQLGQNIPLDPGGNDPHATPAQVVNSDNSPFTGVVAVAAGLNFSLALKADGSIYSWGRNDSFQLGLDPATSVTESSFPVREFTAGNDWTGITAGSDFVLAIKADGTIYAWGNNALGQLARGTTLPAIQPSPVQTSTPGNPLDWRYVAAGQGHAIALKTNGTIYGWGGNANGQIGDGTLTDKPGPVQVATNTLDWVSIEAGDFFSLGRKGDGSLWGWGDNTANQLGIAGIATAPTRLDVGPYIAQSAGATHSTAIFSDGTLWSWGGNDAGQLGNGTTTNVPSPTQIGTETDWTAVSAGASHSVALNARGELLAWGDNSFGQLGAVIADPTVPSLIDAGPWKAAVAGGFHSVALNARGELWAWGDNSFGQLGDGTTNQANLPILIDAGPWVAIAAGDSHTLALKADGTIFAWGLNADGQIGDSSTTDKTVPTAVSAAGTWTAVAAGNFHSLARRSDGTVWAWGQNVDGQIGNGASLPGAAVTVPAGPLASVAPAALVASLGGGFSHSAVIKADGSLWLWGNNDSGQLGAGTSGPGTNTSTPDQLVQPKIAVSTATLNFGSRNLGTSASLSLTIGNPGTSTLSVGAVTGLTGTDFAVVTGGSCGDGTAPFNITAGGNCSLSIVFTPTLGAGVNAATKTATLSLTANDPDNTSVSVALTGTALRKFAILAATAGNGTISPSGSVQVDPGGGQLFTIAANAGAKVVDVVVDGLSIGPVTSYLFTGVTEDHVITASFAAADFADSWNWRNPLPTGHSLRQVAGNGTGVHIAVGDYGTILRSTDNGATWTMIENGRTNLNGVAFGNSTFVAVGTNGRILTSSNGLAWTSRHAGTTSTLRSVTFGNGVFVAVGNTHTDPTTLVPGVLILTSADGSTWTSRQQALPLNTSLDLHDVAFGTDGVNNVFVAAGQGGYILKSTDNGATWLLNGLAAIDPALPLPVSVGNFDFYGITFAANTFVAVGASAQVHTAAIAATPWTQRTMLSFADLRDVSFNGSAFIAVGASGEIWSSANGAAWTQQTSGLEATVLTINSIAPAGSGFLAVGDDGIILTSANGATWANPYPQSTTTAPLQDVHYANGTYVAVGDVDTNGKAAVITSVDGATWTAVVPPASHALHGITFGNGLLVAVGQSGIDQTGDPGSRAELLTSADNGASWTSRTSATSLNLNGVAFGNNRFVAVGDWGFDEALGANNNAVIITSTDGITWTHQVSPALDMLRRVTYANGRFVAIGDNGTVLVSVDGITWIDHSLNFGPHFTGVAGTAGTFAAVASNSTQIYRSTDNGATWTTASHIPADLPTGVLRGITFAAGQFVAVAESDLVFSSTDAINWSTRIGAEIFPFGTRDLRSITFGNGRLVAVGVNGTIMQSAANSAAAALPALSLSPASLTLAPVEIGTNADTVFTITNRGGGNLSVGSITSGSALFTVPANSCGFPVAPGNSCTFTVRFAPIAPSGAVTTTSLTIVADDPSSPAIAALTGTAKDTIAPDTSITAGPANPSNNTAPSLSFTSADVTATFECSLDGVAFTACTSPATLNSLGNGSHTFRVRAVDVAGNTDATPAVHAWTVDTVAPITTATPAGGLFNASQTISLAANESATIYFTTDGSVPGIGSTVYSSPITISTTTTLRFFARDVAGNTAAPSQQVFVIDTIAPVTTASPVPGLYDAPIDVALAASETATIRYTTDGSTPTAASPVYAGGIAVTAATSPLTIKYFATDGAGNAEAVQTAVYTVHAPDLTATVLINNGATVVRTPQVTLTLQATDATGVIKMRFSNDGVTYTADEAYQTTKTWELSAGDGTRTVYVRFTDGANRLYEPVIAQVVVNSAAPLLTLTQVASPTSNTAQSIGGTVATGSTVAVTMGSSAIAGTVTYTGSGPIINWSSNITGLVFGSNSITVTATDSVGNQAVLNSLITFRPDGKVMGGSTLTIADALRVLQIAAGLVTPTPSDYAHGDVAPLANGTSQPDGLLDVRDALVILRAVIGLYTI